MNVPAHHTIVLVIIGHTVLTPDRDAHDDRRANITIFRELDNDFFELAKRSRQVQDIAVSCQGCVVDHSSESGRVLDLAGEAPCILSWLKERDMKWYFGVEHFVGLVMNLLGDGENFRVALRAVQQLAVDLKTEFGRQGHEADWLLGVARGRHLRGVLIGVGGRCFGYGVRSFQDVDL